MNVDSEIRYVVFVLAALLGSACTIDDGYSDDLTTNLRLESSNYLGLYVIREYTDGSGTLVCQRPEAHRTIEQDAVVCGNNVELSRGGIYQLQLGAYGVEGLEIKADNHGTVRVEWNPPPKVGDFPPPITIESNVLRFSVALVEIDLKFGIDRVLNTEIAEYSVKKRLRLPISHGYQFRIGGLGRPGDIILRGRSETRWVEQYNVNQPIPISSPEGFDLTLK